MNRCNRCLPAPVAANIGGPAFSLMAGGGAWLMVPDSLPPGTAIEPSPFMSDLEIISRLPARSVHPTPLLFVHGAFSGAWIWDAKFLGYLARQGFAAHALSLRGHGGSGGGEWLHWYGLSDYVEDVADAVARIGTPPILIGHSMGGMVVQQYMRSFPSGARGVVLMASVPPYGLWDGMITMSLRSPEIMHQLVMLQVAGPQAVQPTLIGRALFSPDMPPDEIQRYEPFLQSESARVSWEMFSLAPFLRWNNGNVPVMVMGAEADLFVPPAQVRMTAEMFHVEPVIFPSMAHAMMLEPDWSRVADRVAGWVADTVPGA